eukprot:CAMPEP_0206424332 /NCGR_PEP_ID=MMETSP0324_2-20121206/3170_1 /ASSEMBLY_ACC=CAM_ASM_000836 /TAXON_ID=2866 /ORGANISM="Crypthecodinium cohnii, Strain Seligo" /LENGTH=41 /DNA_ID= /DNA_START= /DNA_END= /DNA_ORIENTATION=
MWILNCSCEEEGEVASLAEHKAGTLHTSFPTSQPTNSAQLI